MSHIRTGTTRTRISSVAALAVLGASTSMVAVAAPAAASGLGSTSLVQVLNADGNKLDQDWDDFDITHRAVTTVLDAKPGSAVGVLADGSTPLTAFIPTDRAFRRLVFQLTGDRPGTESATFDAVAGLGVKTVEQVLLYHVVPGSTITYAQAKKADGAKLTTASADRKFQVVVNGSTVRLRDRDNDAPNPRVVQQLSDLNKGNKQIAHGISRVLRPIDLP
jgi:Fasciclin domain